MKCQVAPRVLVKVKKTCTEGNGDVSHFVCLVYTLHYKCRERALVVKAYLRWYIYIHLIFFFHRKLFSKKLQLLLLEEVEWFKSLMRKRINGPEELKLELRINWFWKIRFKGNIKCSSSRTIKLIVIKWVGIASKVGYFDQISFKFQGVGFEESFSERHQ